jgi:hypothetical protein
LFEGLPMTSRRNQKNKAAARDRSRIKDPSEWVTGDEPMTGAQESYLETLGREAGEEVEPDLSKAEASERIEELQEKTGRKP